MRAFDLSSSFFLQFPTRHLFLCSSHPFFFVFSSSFLYFLWCVLHLLYNFPLPLFPTFPNWLPTRSSFCLSSSLFLYLFSSVLYGNLSVIYQQSERERARRRERERIKGDQSSGLKKPLHQPVELEGHSSLNKNSKGRWGISIHRQIVTEKERVIMEIDRDR